MMYTCTGAPLTPPKIGDRLYHKPFFGIDNLAHPLPCTVVYVNEAHSFYTVRFEAGYRQSYKVFDGMEVTS